MRKKVLLFFCGALAFFPVAGWGGEQKGSAREATVEELEGRGRTEMLSYFFGEPKDASGLKIPIAIDLYNQAVEFYEKKEYDLARQALRDSLSYDAKNPLAYELLGDIAYYEHQLDQALKHYESSYLLKSRPDLKEKILQIQKERKVDSGLSTEREEHFLIKYHDREQSLDGFELREFLRNAYREVGQDLGYFLKQKVTVLLYDELEFQELTDVPHWSSGLYDGKIRLPAYQKGFTPQEIRKIMRHELTHAFIVEISRGRCPAWLNEGLAEYEEAKVEALDLRVFRAAVRTGTLFPLSDLFSQKRLLEMRDPLEAALFYVEAYHLVHYLVERYGMFQIKKMIELFGEGKDSFEVIQSVFKISPLELEKQWKQSFGNLP